MLVLDSRLISLIKKLKKDAKKFKKTTRKTVEEEMVGARAGSVWNFIDNSLRPAIVDNLVGLLLPNNNYINFGSNVGETGYGFRDTGGIIQHKNSGGNWVPFAAGSLGGLTPDNLTDTFSPIFSSAANDFKECEQLFKFAGFWCTFSGHDL